MQALDRSRSALLAFSLRLGWASSLTHCSLLTGRAARQCASKYAAGRSYEATTLLRPRGAPLGHSRPGGHRPRDSCLPEEVGNGQLTMPTQGMFSYPPVDALNTARI